MEVRAFFSFSRLFISPCVSPPGKPGFQFPLTAHQCLNGASEYSSYHKGLGMGLYGECRGPFWVDSCKRTSAVVVRGRGICAQGEVFKKEGKKPNGI